MTNNILLRRAFASAGLCAGVAVAVAGCSSSSNGNPVGAFTSGAGSVSSAVNTAPSSVSSALPSSPSESVSSSPTTSESSSSSSSSVGGGGTGGSKTAACSALTDLVSLSGKIAATVQKSGGAAAHFGELKALYGQMDQLSKKIAAAAPSDISTDAKTFSTSIATLDAAVQKASSSADVQAKASSDPKLKAATAGVSSSITNLVTWKTKNC